MRTGMLVTFRMQRFWIDKVTCVDIESTTVDVNDDGELIGGMYFGEQVMESDD